MHKDDKTLVIADGAAFGSEIDRVMRLIRGRKNIALYLPESFEWLVLSTGVVKNGQINQVLSNPSNYINSEAYFSWEQFFSSLLIEETKGTYLAYAKRKLNPAYLNSVMKESILNTMEKIDLGWKIKD